jgi:hypothetical protein
VEIIHFGMFGSHLMWFQARAICRRVDQHEDETDLLNRAMIILLSAPSFFILHELQFHRGLSSLSKSPFIEDRQ